MQIHELTQKKTDQIDEGLGSAIGNLAGGGVNAVKDVGSALASPFKDVAQGYRSVRQDQKVGAMADKAFRAWQNYVAQLEQSIAKQPAPPAPPPTTSSTGGQTQKIATGSTHTAGANNPNKTATTPGATTPPPAAGTPPAAKASGAQQTPLQQATALHQQAQTQAGATTPATAAKPNYGAQTGAGAKVTYNQPTGVPNPMAKTPQSTSAIGPKTPGVTVTTPAGTTSTPATTPAKPGQMPASVANSAQGKKMQLAYGKPPGGIQGMKSDLEELQQPAAAVSPALAAFRDRSDGKYEAYLKAFVQKNLLSGLGFRGLVNQQEIDNAIKAIAAPANADPAKQKPLWTDLVRACALAVPTAGALTGRDPKVAKDPNAPGTTTKPGAEQKPGEGPAAQAEPAKPAMTKDQISQWISRNSEDHATLKAALDAINAVKG